jgi:predicted RNase H-like nuclease (RuvC/YqgF family)
MGKKYELKRVEEEIWRKTPLEIREKKYRFSNLRDWIGKRKKKIEKLEIKIKELKLERREWEKEKNKLFSELHSFQYNYHPSVSPTQQVSKRNQWSINLTIGGLKRKVYLGSDSNVRERLDELKFDSKYTTLGEKRHSMDGHELVKEEIRKIIQQNLVNELKNDFDGFNEKWKKNELKMWDYLNNSVKN